MPIYFAVTIGAFIATVKLQVLCKRIKTGAVRYVNALLKKITRYLQIKNTRIYV
jgi:hypothetical protein